MNIVKVKLTGKYALFTDATTNVERYSYPVPTFSAVKGALEAIYWKPEFTWQILSVQVLNEIKYQNFLRNEVIKQKYSLDRKAVSIVKNRTQRNSMVLLNPSYVVTAKVIQKPHDKAHYFKHIDIFNDRVKKGACYRQPYLGLKEYACDFSFPTGDEVVHDSLFGEKDFGLMLESFSYDTNGARPSFKNYKMVDGLVRVQEN